MAERGVKHANDNKGQGIRANSAKSEGGNWMEDTPTAQCTQHSKVSRISQDVQVSYYHK